VAVQVSAPTNERANNEAQYETGWSLQILWSQL